MCLICFYRFFICVEWCFKRFLYVVMFCMAFFIRGRFPSKTEGTVCDTLGAITISARACITLIGSGALLQQSAEGFKSNARDSRLKSHL